MRVGLIFFDNNYVFLGILATGVVQKYKFWGEIFTSAKFEAGQQSLLSLPPTSIDV